MKKTACTLFLSFLLATPLAFVHAADAEESESAVENTQVEDAGIQGDSEENVLSPSPSRNRSEVAEARKKAQQARIEFHEAMRQYLLSMPDMTAEEDALARAAFLRTNFDWSVEVALLEQEYIDARKALPARPAEPAGMADLEATVDQLKGDARNANQLQYAEAYHRAAIELILAEEAADRESGGE